MQIERPFDVFFPLPLRVDFELRRVFLSSLPAVESNKQ